MYSATVHASDGPTLWGRARSLRMGNMLKFLQKIVDGANCEVKLVKFTQS